METKVDSVFSTGGWGKTVQPGLMFWGKEKPEMIGRHSQMWNIPQNIEATEPFMKDFFRGKPKSN